MKRTTTAKWMENQKRWQINVQKDGKRRTFTSSKPGRTGQREANAKADAWLDEGVNRQNQKVQPVYLEWLEKVRETTSPSNYRPTESRARIWVLPAIGLKRIDRVTEQDLQNIVDKAYSQGHLSKKTLKSLCGDLRAFFKYCRKNKLTSFRPEFLTIPKEARYKGKEILQPRDLLTLLNVSTTLWRGKCVEDPLIHAYRFQVISGLRPGELIGLRWSDIEGRTVHIRQSINVDGNHTLGKNENAVRSFVLSGYAERELDAQREETGEEEYIFPITSERYYRGRFRKYCEANNMTVVCPYSLRHTFVSIAKNLPEGEVKALVGHSRDMDTFGVYGHEMTGDDVRLAESVTGLFDRLLDGDDCG